MITGHKSIDAFERYCHLWEELTMKGKNKAKRKKRPQLVVKKVS